MTDMEFLQMLSGIDEELITKADRPIPLRKRRGFKIALIAAVLALALLLTPIAGAFALTAGYKAANPDFKGGPIKAITQILSDTFGGDAPSGGLVSDLLDASRDENGNLDWNAFFAALLGNDQEHPKQNGYSFETVTLPDGTVKITKFVNSKNEEVIHVPEEIAGAKVTVIGEWAFAKDQSITHVSLPDTITTIESNAFHSCTNLGTVNYSLSLVEIGDYAFAACNDLVNCDLPSSLKTLGSFAFLNCSSITSVTIPSSLRNWGDHSFYSCTNLQSLEIREGVTTIPSESFRGTKIQELNLPASVTYVEDYAFAYCKELQTVSFCEGLKSIGRDAFAVTGIKQLDIPSTVTVMGDVTFAGCELLTYVIFAGDAPEVLYGTSTMDNQASPAFTVLYRLGAKGFDEPQWQGHTCQKLLYEAESFVLEKLPDYPGYHGTLPYYSYSVLATEQTKQKGRALEVISSYSDFKYYQSEYGLFTDDTVHDAKYFKTNALIFAQVRVSPKEELIRLSGIVLREDGVSVEVYPIFTFSSQPEKDKSFTYTYVLIEIPKKGWGNLTVGAYADSHIRSHNIFPDGIARSHHYMAFVDMHASYPSNDETDTACG